MPVPREAALNQEGKLMRISQGWVMSVAVAATLAMLLAAPSSAPASAVLEGGSMVLSSATSEFNGGYSAMQPDFLALPLPYAFTTVMVTDQHGTSCATAYELLPDLFTVTCQQQRAAGTGPSNSTSFVSINFSVTVDTAYSLIGSYSVAGNSAGFAQGIVQLRDLGDPGTLLVDKQQPVMPGLPVSVYETGVLAPGRVYSLNFSGSTQSDYLGDLGASAMGGVTLAMTPLAIPEPLTLAGVLLAGGSLAGYLCRRGRKVGCQNSGFRV
jgi:hypothetical protein